MVHQRLVLTSAPADILSQPARRFETDNLAAIIRRCPQSRQSSLRTPSLLNFLIWRIVVKTKAIALFFEALQELPKRVIHSGTSDPRVLGRAHSASSSIARRFACEQSRHCQRELA